MKLDSLALVKRNPKPRTGFGRKTGKLLSFLTTFFYLLVVVLDAIIITKGSKNLHIWLKLLIYEFS